MRIFSQWRMRRTDDQDALRCYRRGDDEGTGSKRQVIQLPEELEVKRRKGLWLTHNRFRGGSGKIGFRW